MVPFAASKDAEIIDDFANSEALLGQAVAVLVVALGGWPWDGTTPQRSITNATRADRDIVLRRAGCGCNTGTSRADLLNAAMRLLVMLVSGAAGAGEPQQALSHATQGCASPPLPPPPPCRGRTGHGCGALEVRPNVRYRFSVSLWPPAFVGRVQLSLSFTVLIMF
jgi:hypothetical protein